MRSVSVYIYIDELIDDVLTPIAHRIELFNDEAINITSSIQNFKDLGKVFTDYSKSFTIPASKVNNKIFSHWYNSEVGATSIDNPLSVDGAFDHRITYYGFVEIDTEVFRYGKFSLKGSKKTNNMIESYSIEFKGNLSQIKELFKDDKLNALSYFIDGIRYSPYDTYNHPYNVTEIKNRINSDASLDVLYPVIGTKRKFFLNSGIATQDISNTTGKLLISEIFPALRVSKILEAIQQCYGITFEGAFIESQTFSKLFLYLKNQDGFTIKAEQLQVNFTSKDSTTYILDAVSGDTFTEAFGFNDLDLTTNVYTCDLDFLPFFAPVAGLTITNRNRVAYLRVITASSNPYNVYVYNNGILFNTFEGLVGNTNSFFMNDYFSTGDIIYNFTFFVSSDTGISFTTELHEVITIFGGGANFQQQEVKAYSTSQSTTSNIDIKAFIPDITVLSFIEGLIKMFNLMVLPTGEKSFYLQTLNDYYTDGINIDITKYVIADEISIDPPSLYKRISFKYEKSINILNEFFRSAFNKEYGDLNFENKNSAVSDTYEVSLPFENFMFDRETDTNFITATILDKDLKPYVPKPSLIYCNGEQSVTPDIKVSDGTTTFNISNYVRFSNELPLASTDLSYTQSLNWGAEISAWDLNTNFTGLYKKFYSTYIENLFNQRTRIVKLKANLPTSLLCSIRLKDKIIVSNKRYIINTMTPELTSGDTTFELILDSNPLNDTNVTPVLRTTNLQYLRVDNTKQYIEVQVFIKDFDLWRAKNAIGFMASGYPYGTNFYKDGLLNIIVPENTTGLVRIDEVLIEYFKGADSTTISIPVYQDA